VVGALVAPVGDIDGAVGAHKHIDRPEPAVIGGHQVATEFAGEAGALALERVPVDGVRQQVRGDVLVLVLLGKGPTRVEDAATGDVAALESLIGDVLEIAEGVRVVQGAVLAEALDVVAALHLVQRDLPAPVGAGDDVAVAVEIESPGVAATLGKQLEFLGPRVIAPDALLEFAAANLRRHRAALGAVQPAVRAPLQRVGKGMGILHAETFEQHFRIAVRFVAAGLDLVEEQIG
jgi:hypothetical protein